MPERFILCNPDKSVFFVGTDIKKLYHQYLELLDYQRLDDRDLDYRILDIHIPLLESIDVVESGCISIFDMFRHNHAYYSPKYKSLLGWDSKLAESDIEYTNKLIHPEDLPVLLKAGIYFMTMGFSLPAVNKKDFKCIFDYRVIGKQGKYVRIIEQQLPLELDKKGNVWLVLSMLDLSPVPDTEAPFRGRLVNHRTGELFRFPPDEELPYRRILLTRREKEVLQLIARGLISKEIADKLFISVNTVNTHRQRIIEKLNVSNTYEAIRYANEMGLFM